MGKSRSATCCVAYLMQAFKISPAEALAQIRQSRPMVEPNEGFMQQLEIYHQMQMTSDVDNSPIYQRWLYQREVQASSDCGQAPEADKIRFEDEHAGEHGEDSADLELRCRKCRLVIMSTILFNFSRLIASSSSYSQDGLWQLQHISCPISSLHITNHSLQR
jgi:dual specificity phosphatase 12